MLTHPAALLSKASALPGFWRKGSKAQPHPHLGPLWSLISRDRAQAPGPSGAKGLNRLGERQVATPRRLDTRSCSATYCPSEKRPPVPGAWL